MFNHFSSEERACSCSTQRAEMLYQAAGLLFVSESVQATEATVCTPLNIFFRNVLHIYIFKRWPPTPRTEGSMA